MFQKIVLLFLSFVALSSCQLCPPPPGSPSGTPATNCTLVPGCNFMENGTLTPQATQCSNQLTDSDCQQLFPCSSSGTPACNQPGTPAGTAGSAGTYPYVRAPACTDPNIQDIALQCAKQCGMCCLSPAYNCADDPNSPISCSTNVNKCQDANWTNIMAQYCPNTCGLCTAGACRDLNSGCNTMVSLCKNVDWVTYMNTNCARTCGTCSTTTPPSSTCVDVATNCSPNSNLCTDPTYQSLMQQQCCATCKSAGSGSCADSSTSCASWAANGFCSSSFYSTTQKQQYCGHSCKLC